MSKKIINCLVIVVLLLVCTSCKAIETYTVKEYLTILANQSGIYDGQEYDEIINSLTRWHVIDENDKEKINENLNYGFLIKTVGNLLECDESNLLKEDIIDKKNDASALVDKKETDLVIEKAVSYINNKECKTSFSYKEKENVKKLIEYKYENNRLITKEKLNIGDVVFIKEENTYKRVNDILNDSYILVDATLEETLEELQIEDSFELDFDKAIDIPGGKIDDDSLYVNNLRTTLSSNSKSFNADGFRISYNFNSSGLHARVSKSIEGVNTFFDISLSGIKPSYKWKYSGGQIEDAYFKIDYRSTCELGASIGKYNKYYLDLKNKDSSSFLNSLKSIIKPKDDEVEATIKICEIKTPIAQIPTLYFNIDVLIRIYTTGKVELLLYNNNSLGIEVKEGNMRLIHDTNKDLDFSIGGSSRAILGVNFNLEAAKQRLMDIEIDSGIRAAVSSTAHLYDEEGNKTTTSIDYPYSSADELAKENENVKICGDVSFNWVLNLSFNTSKALLSKFGLSKTKEILDEDNQIFNNKTHIENGVFVKQCTRKGKLKPANTTTSEINVDKIILGKYSAVVDIGKTYEIPIRALPNGYDTKDLIYSSLDNSIVSVSSEGVVSGNKLGACEIRIQTSDSKYSSSINILVSSGE